MPTSSEETKRAKREDLSNKQILIPELCTVHAFPGALWRAAVCLPCTLYRVNGLLVADQIRAEVAKDIGLGTKQLAESKQDSIYSRMFLYIITITVNLISELFQVQSGQN